MIIGLSGSATPQGSRHPNSEALRERKADNIKTGFYRLNEMRIYLAKVRQITRTEYGFFHDDAYMLFEKNHFLPGVILVAGLFSIRFRAQTKAFIDRSNCLRPADFSDMSKQDFKEPVFKGKIRRIILVPVIMASSMRLSG